MEAMLKQLSITTNLFDRCLKAFAFFLPIIWLPNFTQSNLQLLLFNYGALLLFGLSISLPAKREFSNYNLLLILVISAVLSLIRNSHTLGLSFLNIIFGCLLYYAIVRSAEDINGILNCFIWVFFINVFIAILQICKIELLYSPYFRNVSNALQRREWSLVCGFMAHKNHLAMFTAIVSPFLMKRKLWAGILPLIIVIYLGCFSAILAFLIGLGILLYFKIKNKKIKIGIIFGIIATSIILAIYLFLSGNISKITSRLPSWNFMLKESFVNPFIGWGLDSFKAMTNLTGMSNLLIIQSYNEFLRLTYEFGIIPFFIIISSVFLYFKKIYIKDNSFVQTFLASVISFIPIMIFQDPLHIPRVGVPMLVILALFEASCLKGKEIKNDNQS